MSKTIMIDTSPRNSHSGVNLGIIIAAKQIGADIVRYNDSINIDSYDEFCFNVYYVTNIFNALYFINKNKIDLKDKSIVFGGQGVSNLSSLLDDIGEVFKGELDHNAIDSNGWNWATSIISEPYTFNRYGIIELTRGCKYSCGFCEYGNVTGGSYREKNVDLVISQMDYCKANGVRNINLLSANLAGYSEIEMICEHAMRNNLRIVNSDMTIMDIHRFIPWFKIFRLPKIKIGIESFDFETRRRIGKGFTDAKLINTIKEVIENTRGVFFHFYMIYGLPGDDYNKWFDWLRELGNLRREYTVPQSGFWGNVGIPTKGLIYQFSLTDFIPCRRTAMENDLPVDYELKNGFLNEWVSTLVKEGFLPKQTTVDYSKSRGRMGIKENHYKLLIKLRTAKYIDLSKITKGIGISISDDEAIELMKTLR